MIIAMFFVSIALTWACIAFALIVGAGPILQIKYNWEENDVNLFAAVWPISFPFFILIGGIILPMQLAYAKYFKNWVEKRKAKLEVFQEILNEKRSQEKYEKEEQERKDKARIKMEVRMRVEKDESRSAFRNGPSSDLHCALCGADSIHWRKDMLAELEQAAEEATAEKKKRLETPLRS